MEGLIRSFYCQVGHWRESTGVNMTRNFTETITEIVESLQNKTLVVTTIMVRSKCSGSGQNFYIQSTVSIDLQS